MGKRAIHILVFIGAVVAIAILFWLRFGYLIGGARK
jgi:hypothetical protein